MITSKPHSALFLLFSRSVMSHSSWPHGLQHSRLPCPSPSPRACTGLGPLSQWCHLTISSFFVPFSSCLLFFLSIRVFSNESALRIRWPNIRASTSASVLPVNIQDWSPLESTGLISLLSKGLLRVFSSNIIWKNQFFGTQSSLWSNSHIHTWLLEKP